MNIKEKILKLNTNKKNKIDLFFLYFYYIGIILGIIKAFSMYLENEIGMNYLLFNIMMSIFLPFYGLCFFYIDYIILPILKLYIHLLTFIF